MATPASPPAQPLYGDQVRASSRAADRPFGVTPWLGVGALLLAGTLVFWLFDALPFQDLPAHAGLIAMRHRFASSPFEQRYYVVHPHLGPYTVFRVLGETFVRWLGPLGAVRALATLPLAATPVVLVWARRRLHGDPSPTAAYVGLALGFGFMTLLGFASYLLGIAFLIVATTLWLEMLVAADARDPRSPALRRAALRSEIAVGAFSPLVFLAHGHAFLLFLAVAAIATVATGRRLRRVLRFRALIPAVTLAAWTAWRERACAVPAGSAALPHAELAPHFQGPWDKLSLLITPTLLTRTGVDALVGVALWVVLVAAVVATARGLGAAVSSRVIGLTRPELRGDGPSRAHSRALLAAAGGLTAAFLVLPHSIGWFGFVDGRLVPLILLLALLAVRRPDLSGVTRAAFDVVPPVAAGAMVSIALLASLAFQREASGWREVLSLVPAGARLLNLPIQPNSRIFTAHPFVHYDKLVMVDRPVVVSDVWFHQGTAIYPTAENPSLALPGSYSESDLRAIDWPAYHLSDWDYVLIRTRPESDAPPVPPALTIDAHRGGWWLYRVARRP